MVKAMAQLQLVHAQYQTAKATGQLLLDSKLELATFLLTPLQLELIPAIVIKVKVQLQSGLIPEGLANAKTPLQSDTTLHFLGKVAILLQLEVIQQPASNPVTRLLLTQAAQE
jgi:hypothetical protein